MGYYERAGLVPWMRGDELGAGVARTGWLVASPQKKFAYGTGRRCGSWGCLVQCDSIHRTRGSGPGGDTGSTNTRT